MAEMMITQKLGKVLDDEFPSLQKASVVEQTKDKLVKAEDFFNELEEVYSEKEKYSLHWAFDNASIKMKNTLQKIEEKESSMEHIEERTYLTKDIKNEINKASTQYNLLSRITLALDVIISVILILGVTLIAQRIEQNLNSIIIETSFIAIIALLKVSLDRFYIIPSIDAWGWNRYHKLTHKIGENIAEMIIYGYLNKTILLRESENMQSWVEPEGPLQIKQNPNILAM